MMEVYAGVSRSCDDNIGRVIEAVEETGELDNTLIIYIDGRQRRQRRGHLAGPVNEIAVAANGVEEDFEDIS